MAMVWKRKRNPAGWARVMGAWVTALWLLGAMTVSAAESVDPKQETAHDVVEQATDVMFEIVREHEGGKDDREAYYEAIQEVLDPVVDFSFIAQAVMGSHRDDASEEQIEAFTDVFKKGLVETYARGIANYSDSEITIRPPKDGDANKRRVGVDQEVRHDGSQYRLSYTMAKNNSGEWKLINLVLDGVNLGQSFRSQFSQAARKYDGDVEKVIDNWLDEM